MRQKTATKIFPSRGFIHQLPSLGNVSRSHVPVIINNRRWPFSTIRQVTIFHNNAWPETRRGSRKRADMWPSSAGAPRRSHVPSGSGLVQGPARAHLPAKPPARSSMPRQLNPGRHGFTLILPGGLGRSFSRRPASSKPWIRPSEDTYRVKKSSSIASPNFKLRLSFISDA